MIATTPAAENFLDTCSTKGVSGLSAHARRDLIQELAYSMRDIAAELPRDDNAAFYEAVQEHDAELEAEIAYAVRDYESLSARLQRIIAERNEVLASGDPYEEPEIGGFADDDAITVWVEFTTTCEQCGYPARSGGSKHALNYGTQHGCGMRTPTYASAEVDVDLTDPALDDAALDDAINAVIHEALGEMESELRYVRKQQAEVDVRDAQDALDEAQKALAEASTEEEREEAQGDVDTAEAALDEAQGALDSIE